jgi:hypothetical protein
MPAGEPASPRPILNRRERWPRLLAAEVAIRLSGRLLAAAERFRRRRRAALALLVLADRCSGLGRRMLTVR